MSILDRLDNFYYKRNKTDAYILTILVAGLIGYLIYTLLSETAHNYRLNQESINVNLNREINNAKNYLDSITVNGDREYKIKELDRNIKDTNNKINLYRMKLNKISTVMKKDLSPVLYTKDNWSSFLNSITNQAKKDNIKLYSLSNSVPKENNSTFGKVLTLDIKAQGEFNNIVYFIHDLENSKLVTTIESIKLKSSKYEPSVDINMSVWGIKP